MAQHLEVLAASSPRGACFPWAREAPQVCFPLAPDLLPSLLLCGPQKGQLFLPRGLLKALHLTLSLHLLPPSHQQTLAGGRCVMAGVELMGHG